MLTPITHTIEPRKNRVCWVFPDVAAPLDVMLFQSCCLCRSVFDEMGQFFTEDEIQRMMDQVKPTRQVAWAMAKWSLPVAIASEFLDYTHLACPERFNRLVDVRMFARIVANDWTRVEEVVLARYGTKKSAIAFQLAPYKQGSNRTPMRNTFVREALKTSAPNRHFQWLTFSFPGGCRSVRDAGVWRVHEHSHRQSFHVVTITVVVTSGRFSNQVCGTLQPGGPLHAWRMHSESTGFCVSDQTFWNRRESRNRPSSFIWISATNFRPWLTCTWKKTGYFLVFLWLSVGWATRWVLIRADLREELRSVSCICEGNCQLCMQNRTWWWTRFWSKLPECPEAFVTQTKLWPYSCMFVKQYHSYLKITILCMLSLLEILLC